MRWLGRDEGYSVALPDSTDLWIFGDTPTFKDVNGIWSNTAFIAGATAMRGPHGGAWSQFDEVFPTRPLRATNAPHEFITKETTAYLPDGSGLHCTPANGAAYEARWPTGAALTPDGTEVLVTYIDICVVSGTSFTAEGWGYEEYNWQTNVFDVKPHDVIVPAKTGAALDASLIMGFPVFQAGALNLYSSRCDSWVYATCESGNVFVTSLPNFPTNLNTKTAYQPTPVTTDGNVVWQPVGVSVGLYPDGLYHMIEQNDLAGDFTILSAPSPSGPWSTLSTQSTPSCQAPTHYFCYAFFGHPELSTPTSIAITYFDPSLGPVVNGNTIGHVVSWS